MEIKKTFVQGKMNFDIDERLLPDGQYPYAENIRVATTDGSNLGSVQNIEGNTQMTSYSLTNASTIGAFADGARYKIYWLVTSDEKDMVIEFDTQTEIPTVLLESNKPNSVLNFDPNYLVTGMVKIVNDVYNKNLLAWTDDRNNPRCINIERAKTYGPDGFEEEDICLIKMPPKYALKTQLTYTASSLENNMEDKFLSFCYRYKYLDGEYSALSTYTNYQFSPKEFDLDYQTMENEGMVNSFNAVKLLFDTGSKRVTDIELIYKESNSNTLYVIQRFNKAEEGWNDDSEQFFVFANDKKYKALPPDELFRSYDNVPRVAKALDLIGNRLVFGNYVEGYDLVNIYGENISLDYDLEIISNKIEGKTVPITLLSSRENLSFDLSGIQLLKNTRLNFVLELENSVIDGESTADADFILNRDYVDANDLASDADFILFVNTILTNRFIQNYTATPPANSQPPSVTGISIVSSTATTIVFDSPTLTYTIDDTPNDPNDNTTHDESFKWQFKSSSVITFDNIATASSLKTNRSYEVGMLYRDNFTRCTSVLTCPENTIYVPQEHSVDQNKIKVTVNHLPPSWADTYKFVVKQNKAEYQTIYTNFFYQDGIYRWILLEGANKDKVHEGDTLIVKSDISGPLSKIIKVRVLEITTKEADFIQDNFDVDGNPIIEEAGVYMKIKPVGFDMTFDAATFRLFQGNRAGFYPNRAFTSPIFGQIINGSFVPYKLKSGSRVRIYILVMNTSLNAQEQQIYDKRFRVQSDYNSVKEWFDAEVENLGDFGIDYLWDGIEDIGPNTTTNAGYGQGDAFNRGSGWDFTSDGSQFWAMYHKRAGNLGQVYVLPVKFEIFFSEGNVIFETEPDESESDIYYETEQTFDIVDGKHTGNLVNQTNSLPAEVEMDFFNCYVQGNGAESYRYKDQFNGKYLNIDLRPSTTTIEKYREIRRYADMTYSEPYSANTNINGLNEFNLAKANYKDDLDKRYGSIQKLFARESNVLVMQEDKIGQVFYGKDLLYNADGSSNLASIDQVLGEWKPYLGEYGISRNPESFVFDGFNIYFTDVKRGAVMRLAGDGINEIPFGMKQFFKTQFSNDDDTVKKGGYDANYDEYYLYDSDDALIRPEQIDCGQSITKINFREAFDLMVNFTPNEGLAGFSFVTNGKPVKFKIKFSNFELETGFYGDPSYNDELINLGYEPVVGNSSDNITFNKSRSLPETINSKTMPLSIGKITVFSPFENVNITLITTCPI
jgi:hypothetical protein